MGFAGDTFFLLELLVHNIIKQLHSPPPPQKI